MRAMDRLERLLDLVHVLQSAREPVPLSSLEAQFTDYRGGGEAVRRKFERDKAELAQIGLVLRYVDDEEAGSGYLLDAAASYLPDLELSDDEHALLASAARAALRDPAFPNRRALRHALAKLDADEEEDTTVFVHHGATLSSAQVEYVELLMDALTRRKRVAIRYRNANGVESERSVDPYAVILKGGEWYLVGHDHRSEETRTFMVSRVKELTVNGKAPGSSDYEIDEAFSASEFSRRSPLTYRMHDPTKVVVDLDADVGFLGARWFQVEPTVHDHVARFEFVTTNLGAVVDGVLALGRRAELIAPAEGRRAIADALRTVVSMHRPAAPDPDATNEVLA